MASPDIYEKMREDHWPAVKEGSFEDHYSAKLAIQPPDLGYVLVIGATDLFPGYDLIVSPFRCLEPNQYFLPLADIHLTVFEFVSVRPDFRNWQGEVPLFQEICREVLAAYRPFTIDFRGTVFTNTSGILAGYDQGVLVEIREELRAAVKKRGFEPMERYHSQTAHVSFLNFRGPLEHPKEFLKLVEATRNTSFGAITVDSMELVEHDWFHRQATRRTIQRFSL